MRTDDPEVLEASYANYVKTIPKNLSSQERIQFILVCWRRRYRRRRAPSPNGYRSKHSAGMGEKGRLLYRNGKTISLEVTSIDYLNSLVIFPPDVTV
jgi:hypothetical protein